jgi:integrase
LAVFCIFYDLPFPIVSVLTLLTFVEFLADNNLSPATISNYLSSCKSKFKSMGLAIENFNNHLLKLSIRSLYKNAVVKYKKKYIVNIEQFQQLILAMQDHPLYVFYKMAMLLGFLGMFRISNVANISFKQFDCKKHFTRGDIQLTQQCLKIILKWSKTLQNYTQGAEVTLPALQSSQLCPVQTFQILQHNFPVPYNYPLLSYKSGTRAHMFTRSMLQKMLKQAALKCNIQHQISFHILRRSAASLAFASGVPLEHIKAHGTWSSEAIWSYIHSSVRSALLPKFFQNVFLTTSTARLGSG